MFTYCNNNPVMCIDPCGTFVCTLTGLIIGGIIGAINAAIEGDDVIAGAAIGAATGALAGAATDVAIATGGAAAVVIAATGGAIASGINYVGNEIANERELSYSKLAVEMTIGAAANLLTFGAGGGTLSKVGGKFSTNICNNFQSSILANTTKKVGGKVVRKTAKTVVKHIFRNSAFELSMTGAISWGAWLNSKVWGGLVQ